MMSAKRTSDGRSKKVECSDSGEVKVLLCGLTASGVVVPVRVDDLGKIVLSS